METVCVEFFGGPKDGAREDIPLEAICEHGTFAVFEHIPQRKGDGVCIYLVTEELVAPDVYRCIVIAMGEVKGVIRL